MVLAIVVDEALGMATLGMYAGRRVNASLDTLIESGLEVTV